MQHSKGILFNITFMFYVLFSLVHFPTDYTVYFSLAVSMLHVRLSYVIKVLLSYYTVCVAMESAR